MRLTTGTFASLALTLGSLLLLVAAATAKDAVGRRPARSSYLRSHSSRKLYNYSRNNGNGGSAYQGNNYNGYSGAYGGNYGGNYGNDDANSGNGDNYVWARDDDDNYGNDDQSYYNVNNNYKADGSSYNGRDQQWGGQSVQQYTDDEEPEITVVEYDEDKRWMILGNFGGLNAAETLSLVGLLIFISLGLLALFMLANGFNIFALCQLYCFSSIFGHKDEKAAETVDEGFVKLGDY